MFPRGSARAVRTRKAGDDCDACRCDRTSARRAGPRAGQRVESVSRSGTAQRLRQGRRRIAPEKRVFRHCGSVGACRDAISLKAQRSRSGWSAAPTRPRVKSYGAAVGRSIRIGPSGCPVASSKRGPLEAMPDLRSSAARTGSRSTPWRAWDLHCSYISGAEPATRLGSWPKSASDNSRRSRNADDDLENLPWPRSPN